VAHIEDILAKRGVAFQMGIHQLGSFSALSRFNPAQDLGGKQHYAVGPPLVLVYAQQARKITPELLTISPTYKDDGLTAGIEDAENLFQRGRRTRADDRKIKRFAVEVLGEIASPHDEGGDCALGLPASGNLARKFGVVRVNQN